MTEQRRKQTRQRWVGAMEGRRRSREDRFQGFQAFEHRMSLSLCDSVRASGMSMLVLHTSTHIHIHTSEELIYNHDQHLQSFAFSAWCLILSIRKRRRCDSFSDVSHWIETERKKMVKNCCQTRILVREVPRNLTCFSDFLRFELKTLT